MKILAKVLERQIGQTRTSLKLFTGLIVTEQTTPVVPLPLAETKRKVIKITTLPITVELSSLLLAVFTPFIKEIPVTVLILITATLKADLYT